MSLLLDALNRASKDKAAAAAHHGAGLSQPEVPASMPPVAAESLAQSQAPVQAVPEQAVPILELSLSSSAQTPAAADAWHGEPAPPTQDPVLLEPFVVTESHRTVTPHELSREKAARPPQAVAEPTPSRPSVQPDAPRVAQELVRAKAPAVRSGPPKRLVILGTVAVLIAGGLGSVLTGWWGDPAAWLSPSGIQGPVLGAPAPLNRPQPVGTASDPVDPSPLTVHNADVTPAAPRTSAAKPLAPRSELVEPPARSAATQTSVTPTARLPKPAAQANADPARIVSHTAGPSILELAYAALVQGRLPAAAQAYAQALQAHPEERDALLGLAYIAHQQGRMDEARGYYQRVLRQEPGNPIARSGLLAANAVDDPQIVSSRAHEVAEQNPDSAPAHAALGQVLVREGRVADAQQAFLRAHSLEPGVALYAFNLAVALDRLRDFRSALLYYERALALAHQSGGDQASGVSQSVVRQRLEQLRAANVVAPGGSR